MAYGENLLDGVNLNNIDWTSSDIPDITFDFTSVGSPALGVPLDLSSVDYSSVPYNPDNSRYDNRYYDWATQQAELDRKLQRDLAYANMFNSMNMANMQFMGQAQSNQINYQMNRENIEFQQEENRIAREREDNAIQRRALDLAKAGLSKTLSAGSPASAQSMQAPRYTFSHQNPYSGFAQFGVQLANAMANIRYLDSLTNVNNINASTLLDSNIENLRITESKAGIMALSKNMTEDTYNALVQMTNLSAYSTKQDIELKAEQIVNYQIKNNMLDYEDKHKALTYWIDNLTSIVGSLTGTPALPRTSNSSVVSSFI